MLPASVHARRRQRLADRLGGAPVLLLGCGHRARNLPAVHLPFRQDSTFLYFTGCPEPGAAALLHEGRCTLFLPRPGPGDALWHGETPSLEGRRERYGVEAARPADELSEALGGLSPQVLAVADEERNRLGTDLTGIPLRFGEAHGSPELVQAVIELRRVKDADEVAALREAGRHTAAAHRAVMRATGPGGHERALAALFEGVLAARGCVPGYGTILTQRGEILHCHEHDEALQAGRLLLLDGGGELPSGYGADVTRTWPVSGRFTPRQRAAYDAVLEAQATAIEACRPGVRFRRVHDTACLVLARFLADEGLLRIPPEEAVERGAHAVFFPHGVGHLIGLDVHDLENFGDLPAYPPGQGRPADFGTCYLRLDLPLEEGHVVTVEPGFYLVPAILADPTLRDRFRDAVDWSRAERWLGFGGIRIEDDVCVTSGSPDVLTADAPSDPEAIEALVGSGPAAEELLG